MTFPNRPTPPYTHLHLHTEYSTLDGANKMKPLTSRAKQLGFSAIGITDHGTLAGALDFYTNAKAQGLLPIIGIETYIHNDKDVHAKVPLHFHLCLFAKDEEGYRNLMRLSSEAYINGFYGKPRINKALLRQYCKGLMASSACLQGEIAWNLNVEQNNTPERIQKYGGIKAGGYEAALAALNEYRDIFGEDFYIEIMRHGIAAQRAIETPLLALAKESGTKIIATNDTHYLYKNDATPHDALMCIATNRLFNETSRLKHTVSEFYLKSAEQLHALFLDIPEALANTQELVGKCTLELHLGNPTPPHFRFAHEYAQKEGLDMDEHDYFVHRCKMGLEERLRSIAPEKHAEYRERLEREIDVISKMKFEGYMLIVWDFVRAAKERAIPTGPGRGSAAGSLVAFALGITNIDPIAYHLLFERFLNPERVSMPDIDMDFCQARRDEIFEYVVEKYGRYNVAQVITFSSLLAKGVLRDVARVMGMPYAEADSMAKLIPNELGITLNGKGVEGQDGYVAGAFQKEPKIKELIESNEKAKQIWEFASRLEGLKRNIGIHAAAVVIDSDSELWNKTPLYKPSGEDKIVTQYSMKYLEDINLIKFDFLGLKTLTLIDAAIKLIKSRYGIVIDLDTLDVNESAVYELISSGATLGLFQIESQGMQNLAKRLRPNCFEDIIAMLALYRPGPMESGMLDDFIDRKHGKAPIHYPFDALSEILRPTYGIIVYQEQVMQIVQTIGGFSLGKADLVRRAMGKKIKEEMDKLKNEFVDGAVRNGFEQRASEELFDLIVKFAGYGFNKSHSAAYAMITYQTSYLKHHYPHEFMAALMTSEGNNTEQISKYIEEARHMNIRVLPPDINRSVNEFGVADEGDEKVILFGLGAIKGIGAAAVGVILDERANGEFENLEDFVSRIDAQKVNKKAFESLIKSGAMTRFGHSRRTLLQSIEAITETAREIRRAKEDQKSSLFCDDDEFVSVNLSLEALPEYEPKELLELEKESLGFYVSGHPLDDFKAAMEKIAYTKSSELTQIAEGSTLLLVGKVEDIKIRFSKRGVRYGNVFLSDLHGTIELMAFDSTLKELESFGEERLAHEPVCVKCKLQEQGERLQIMKVLELHDAVKEKSEIRYLEEDFNESLAPLLLVLENIEPHEALQALQTIAQSQGGNRELWILLRNDTREIMIQTKMFVSSSIQTQFPTLHWRHKSAIA